MQDELKTNVVVENKPGAGGRLSMSILKDAPRDGSVMVIAPNALTVMQSIVYAGKLNYDIRKDFVPVAKVAAVPFGLAVPASLPVKNSAELVAYMKANPAKATYATSAAGGHAHFGGLMYGKTTGIDWQMVAYKGGAPLMTDLVGGFIEAGIDTLVDQIEYHRSGKVRILGVFSEQRYPLAPEIPTLAEQGLSNLVLEGWYAAYMPAGTPPLIVKKMEQAFSRVLANPDVKAKLNRTAIEPSFLSSKDVITLQNKEMLQWEPVVKASGFKPE